MPPDPSTRAPRHRARRRLTWLAAVGAVVGAVGVVRARALARDQQLFDQRYGPRSA